jgi:hypothetical protein
MTSLEEFDIRESFDALDNEKLGLLAMDQFYTLYLGLGYEPKVTPKEMNARVQRVRQEEEAGGNEEDNLTVEIAVMVLSKVSRCGRVKRLHTFSHIMFLMNTTLPRLSFLATGRASCRRVFRWWITKKGDIFLPKISNAFPLLLGSQ